MFIQTENSSNPDAMKFLPGEPVLKSETADFPDAAAAEASPLAARVFEVEGVAGVFLDPDSITVTKSGDKDWQIMKPAILGAIMEHFTSGAPTVGENATAGSPLDDAEMDSEVAIQVKELIDTRIKPAATQDGGDVIFKGIKEGVVYLEMIGSGMGLKDGIENMLKHYVPEVSRVVDFRDAVPKPGLDTPEGQTIQKILDENINPSVAGHGGHIALVDVQSDTVYIRLEGGCQGCGMADVTLKQGIETEIMNAVPSITAVLDVTDHADGTNPYYQPGKGGMSPY